MDSNLARRFLLVALSLILSARALSFAPTVNAKGEDVCPEPNDTFQTACNLGAGSDALGFLSRPDDIDAYRVIALAFKSKLTVELSSPGAAYALSLYDWNGAKIAESTPRSGRTVLEATLPLPGAYYVGVGSTNGSFSDGTPYNIRQSIQYEGGNPTILFDQEFRQESVYDGVNDSEDATFTRLDGRLSIASKKAGAREKPTAIDSNASGPVLDDFMFTFDARTDEGTQAGYRFGFRLQEGERAGYFIGVDTKLKKFTLIRFNQSDSFVVSPWKDSAAISSDGVNRTTVVCSGANITVNINGEDVFSGQDDGPRAGRTALGVVTWASPARVIFDNVVAATLPTAVATAVGNTASPTALLSDSFDDSTNRRLPLVSPFPDRYQVGYSDGEYQVRVLGKGLGKAEVPGDYDNTRMGVDVRLVGDPTNVGLFIECRRGLTKQGKLRAYELVVRPDRGVFWLSKINGDQEGNEIIRLTDARASNALKTGNGTNRIEMSCVGTTISASANGIELAKVEDSDYASGSIEVTVFSPQDGAENTEMRLDNLVVTRP